MTKWPSRQPTKLACFILSLALTLSFINCQSVQWEEPNSADSPLIVNPGSYCLPLTILASQMFPWPLHLVSNDSRFVFEAGFVIPYQATYAWDIMGCSGSVPPGNYVIHFSLDNASWSGPGLLYIQVSSSPIQLLVNPVTTITSGSIAGPQWNLVSLSPFSDMTVTATLNNNQFSVSPSSITFRPNSTTQGFTFSTNGNTGAASSATVTYTISGTNAATYQLTQAQAVVNVPGGSNQTSGGTTTTNTTSGGTTTLNTTTTTTTNTTSPPTTTTNTTTPTTTTTNTTTPTTTTTNTTTKNTTTTTNTTSPTPTPSTTTTTTTTPTTTTTTTSTAGGSTLTTNATSLSIISGTYSLPFTFKPSSGTFQNTVWCTASYTGFSFVPQLTATAGSASASAYLGASNSLAAGQYTVPIWCNDPSITAPAPLTVTVSTGRAIIPTPAAMTVSYTSGNWGYSSNMTLDLSANAPWQDVTITPTLPAGEWRLIVNPMALTYTAAVKTNSFNYMVSPGATGNFTVNVTYVISGTNAASYNMSGTGVQTVNVVAH